MRLASKQAFIDHFITVFSDLKAELWLFGSRVDDTKRGGDIDLMIKCYDLDYQRLSRLSEHYHFLLEKNIGERKIDIVLDFDPKYSDRPVILNAKKQGVLLTATQAPSLEGAYIVH